ncbi:MAG: hypothetical protein INH34_17615 [Phycisphaerales bacterium]|nr:hypothetical protein [Phycisphaerales bacterium]
MKVRPLATLLLLAGAAAAQGEQRPKAPVAYPQRDALSPFREPTDVYAPPDEVFRLLRVMQSLADAPSSPRRFDIDGREVVDDAQWRQARADLLRKGLDAGYLAGIMRLNKNAADRATAFYGAFHVAKVDDVFELIAHVPGEPLRAIRERALPRAVAFVRANGGRRFGDLAPEKQDELRAGLPAPGSPAAVAAGIVRGPAAADFLHKLRLVPFLQLLDLDDPVDQAQALWFVKETVAVRPDLALMWLEPSLPRVRELLASPVATVRQEAVGVFQSIGGEDLPAPPADAAALQQWAAAAGKALFPTIRNLNDAIVQLHDGPERDALADAGRTALAEGSIGDPWRGKDKNGAFATGYRIVTVPEPLKALAIPAGAVITSINGVAVRDAASLLATATQLLAAGRPPRVLMVEMLVGGELRAIEYRVL